MSIRRINNNFMMRIRLFFISFVAMFQMLLATQTKAQCSGDFRIVASYDSNGQKCSNYSAPL